MEALEYEDFLGGSVLLQLLLYMYVPKVKNIHWKMSLKKKFFHKKKKALRLIEKIVIISIFTSYAKFPRALSSCVQLNMIIFKCLKLN